MTVHDLKCVLEDLPDDMPVHVIFNGSIDEEPTYNVEEVSDGCPVLYIEGAE